MAEFEFKHKPENNGNSLATTLHNIPHADLFQPKLEIGRPDDKYEKEANEAADRVMMMPKQNDEEDIRLMPEQDERETIKMMPESGVEEQIKMMPEQVETHQGEPATIQRQEDEDAEGLEERLDRIEATYRAMIRDARKDGYNVAADNLQRFLDGTFGTKILSVSVSWLRDFGAITSAEAVNQGRFESSLEDIGYKLTDGEARTFTDHWQRKLTGSIFTELFYASGTSTITSRGTFNVSRSGDMITISGTVTHRWWDSYDWHAGLSAFIPGHGTISDEDALLLQHHRGAAPFDMESSWDQTLAGTIEIIDWWPDSVTFNWTGP